MVLHDAPGGSGIVTGESLIRNLRYSARSFARTPAITGLLIVTIAVGVGANASVHGFVRGLTRRDMPALTSGQVFYLFARQGDSNVGALSIDDLDWLTTHTRAFAWLGGARELQAAIDIAGREDVVSTAAVTARVARLLGLSLEDGVVISNELWQSAFDSRPSIRGEQIRIDGRTVRVAGIAPTWLEGLYLGRNIDLWTPLTDTTLGVDRGSRTLGVFGELRPGVSADDAQAEIRSRRLATGELALVRYTGVTPELAEGLTRIHAVLALAAGAVFLIVCANVASFLLARASARSRETSLRVALGASRSQLVAQMLSDSVLIAVAGAAFGVLLATWTSQILPAFLFESDAKQLVFVPDVLGIGIASAVCAAVTIACGLTPLLEVRHDRPAVVLRRESMGPSTPMIRLRAGLVVAEMAACCMLVVSTGLLLQSFQAGIQTSAGRRFAHSMLITVQSESEPGAIDYFTDVEAAARPAVAGQATAWAAHPPGSGAIWRSFRVEPPHAPFRDMTLDVAAFTPAALEQIKLPPVAGRLFGARDGPAGCRVAVINRVAADTLFGGDAVGRVVIDPTNRRVEIVGVVVPRDTAATGRARPTIYYYPEQTETPNKRVGPALFRIPAAVPQATAILNSNVVSPAYFDGIGAARVAGESLPRTSARDGCRAAVINREAAEQYFGGDAVGGAVIDPRGQRTEIVGVASAPTLGRFQHGAEPSIFFPMQQDVVPRMTLVVNPRAEDAAMLDTLRSRVEGVPGRRGDVVAERLDLYLARTALAPLHVAAVLVRASAGMSIVLAVVGVYGALVETARRRRRELGIRIALGARGWRVVGMVVGEGGRLGVLGAAAGVLGSVAVKAMLVRVVSAPAADSLQTWLAGPVLLLPVVLVASVVPAVRAVMVNPVTVLKDDG